jgi:preprotein translocase subunit YajC
MKFNFKKFFLVIALLTGFYYFMSWVATEERNKALQEKTDKLDQKEIERESWSISIPDPEF